MYSNHAKDYPQMVLQNIGRLTMYIEKATEQQELLALN